MVLTSCDDAIKNANISTTIHYSMNTCLELNQSWSLGRTVRILQKNVHTYHSIIKENDFSGESGRYKFQAWCMENGLAEFLGFGVLEGGP